MNHGNIYDIYSIKFMRLIYEQNPIINDVLNSYEWLPLVNFFHTIIFENKNFDLLCFAPHLGPNYTELFTLLTSNFYQINILVEQALTTNNEPLFAALGHVYSTWLTYFFVQPANNVCSQLNTLPITVTLNVDWSIANLFFITYGSIILWKIGLDSFSYVGKIWFNFIQVIYLWLYSWILGGLDKVESTEEIICLIILWPWCFLIIFSHLYTVANYDYTFGFAEWGLPVTYGLIMLLEHWWAFGAYIFLYITNTKGRRSLLITIFEDIISMVILIARVLLQAVRGVIVGMFHFICREAIWNMTSWWTHNNHANTSIALEDSSLTSIHPILNLVFNVLLTGGSFVIITAIMFLQLIFLIVSVWLFCKCWFISWNKTTCVNKASL